MFYDFESEARLLGEMLTNPVSQQKFVGYLYPGMFYDDNNAAFCAAYIALRAKHIIATEDTLRIHWGDAWQEAGYQVHAALFPNMDKVFPEDMPLLIQHLDELARARRAKQALSGYYGTEPVGNGHAFLKAFNAAHEKATHSVLGGAQRDNIKTICNRVYKDIQTRADAIAAGGSGIRGISTGFETLDQHMSGLMDENLIVIGGRPGHGKTSLITQILDHIVRGGGRAYLKSLEMSADQLVLRILSMRSGLDGQKLLNADLRTDSEWERLLGAFETLTESQWIIDSTGGRSIEEIEASIYEEHSRAPLSVVCVDYAQKVYFHPGRPRHTEIGRLCQMLCGVAKDLKLPVLLVAQIRRDTEKSPKKRPMLSELKESGDLEQDADSVLFVHRPALQGGGEDKAYTELILRKNRHGPTTWVKAKMDMATTTFWESDE